MNDSDRNILASLRHEPCEAHCPTCGACDPYTADEECDRCGEVDSDRAVRTAS